MARKILLAGTAALVLLSLAGLMAAWRISAARPAFSRGDAAFDLPASAERGRLVFAAGDCASCHASPGQSDPLRLGGGLALSSSFGTFRVPNISPDAEDGIGGWSTIDLANALVSGTSPSGQHLYPAMPYTSYAQITPQDIVDLMAYLRTLPKVSGRPPPHDLPFPFSLRRPLGLWKALFFRPTPFRADPGHDATWNRGRYLVEGLGHCAECHSTRNVLGAIPSSKRYAGGPDQEGLGFIPNITPTNLRDWSVDDLETMLSTGQMPDLRFVGSSMVGVVDHTRTLPSADRHAIAVYIKSLPPRDTPAPG